MVAEGLGWRKIDIRGIPPAPAGLDDRPEEAMRRRIGIVVVLLGGWLAGALALDAYGRWARPSGSYDAIVVAGCGTRPDGRPSPALARRTARAVRLWKQGRASRIVLTGGPSRGPKSEARAAADHARKLGVPSSVLVLEERSTSTEENARFAAALVPGARVLVVSDTYHVFRCQRVFGRHFTGARAVGAPARLRHRLPGAFREVVAVGAYAVTGRLGLLG